MSDNGTIISPEVPVKNPDQGTPSGLPPIKPIKVTPAER